MNGAARLKLVEEHVAQLKRCRSCPSMVRPVVSGMPVISKVMLIGQAPGAKEGPLGRPFAWTAGKTLFKWFSSLGLEEDEFRRRVYMAAVCRCFPGKNPKGGDRVPSPEEIQKCSRWIKREVELLEPELIIPVGKLAISQFIPVEKLEPVIGVRHRVEYGGHAADLIALPHPSGASTWHRTSPGKELLSRGLKLIAAHPAFRALVRATAQSRRLDYISP